MNLQSQLLSGGQQLGLELAENQLQTLIAYLELLQKWNRTFNLTAIRDPAKMLSYHLLDSLSIAPQIPKASVCLDVGSGAGLPGIPLAVLLPQTRWTLLDSNGKKTRFMQQAIAHCGINNVEVVQARVEDYHSAGSLDVIISRAYASLSKFCESVAHLLSPGTQLLTMKTTLQDSEVAELDGSRFGLQQRALQVPGIEEARTLVTINQIS